MSDGSLNRHSDLKSIVVGLARAAVLHPSPRPLIRLADVGGKK